jgi:hypothetical protein
MCIAFPVHPQAARDAAQKTKKAWLEFLREMPSRDTLRSRRHLHPLSEESPNAINRKQAFTARLPAPPQADALDVPAVV